MDRLWCIGSNGITEILTQMGAIDGKLLNLSSLDIEFEKTNYTTEKNVNNSRGLLVRYEFMEMIIRVAGAIFIFNKIHTEWSVAVKEFVGKLFVLKIQ